MRWGPGSRLLVLDIVSDAIIAPVCRHTQLFVLLFLLPSEINDARDGVEHSYPILELQLRREAVSATLCDVIIEIL